jgi:predicted lysophospholipase L1 biosynthesis ABC-type transport system permease subunit
VVYMPLAQEPDTDVHVLVRTELEPAAAVSSIREALRQVDPNVPLGDVATLTDVRDRLLTGTSRPAWAIGAFAGMAALLAAIGLYGVLAYTVAQRTREIGLRIALGATPHSMVATVLGGGLTLAVTGGLIGLAAALALSRFLSSMLFGIQPTDVPTLALVGGVLGLVAGMATLVPAIRAGRTSPLETLRGD